MKKINISLIFILASFLFFSISFSSFTIIDNTGDGAHDMYSTPLQEIGTNFMNGTITEDEMASQMDTLFGQYDESHHVDENGALHIGCANNGSLIIFVPDGGGGGGDVVDPPPPPPVITTETGGTCSSYILDRVPDWSSCEISSDWITAGTIECTQINPWRAIYTSCGQFIYTYEDGELVNTSCNSDSCLPNKEIYDVQTDIKTITANINNLSSTCDGTLYANNNDTCKLTLNISGTTNQNKPIVGLSGKGAKNIKDKSLYSSNQVDGGVGNALNFDGVNSTQIQGSGTNFSIIIDGIKSRTPFVKDNGKIELKLEGLNNFTTINLSNIDYNFKKPFTGKISASDDLGLTWDANPILGTQMLYKLGLKEKSLLTWINLENYGLNNFKNEVKILGNGLEIQDVSLSGSTLDSKDGTYFSARINTSLDATELAIPGIQINLPIINYSINGYNVKYYLSNQDDGDDNTPIILGGEEFLGVQVIGILQGDGKSEFTGQKNNFTDLSKLNIRNKIRKNAYILTRNMESGQVVNGVKYVEGDINISGEVINYETLVVKNGNVIITGDLNTNKKKLGIIVLKDGYNVNTDSQNKGNVYVKPSISNINAIIYADGGFISVDSNGNLYVEDSINRTSDLQKQLILKGSLFTRNTIGGAILAGGYYLLPGGKNISDYNKAMIYDLNYIRRGNNGCEDSNGDGICDLYKNPFVIIYNPIIQTNPPKGFGN